MGDDQVDFVMRGRVPLMIIWLGSNFAHASIAQPSRSDVLIIKIVFTTKTMLPIFNRCKNIAFYWNKMFILMPGVLYIGYTSIFIA